MQDKNTPQKQIILPSFGKQQVKLKEYGFGKDFRNYHFTIYLPCSQKKPYRLSRTHRYVSSKLSQFIPKMWQNMIHISTISKVLGVIPKKLENLLFLKHRDTFFYEHYPKEKENDLLRTADWLRNYLSEFGSNYNFAYCTSKIFREICARAGLQCFPTEFNPSSALFEFRKLINIRELSDHLISTYKNELLKRFSYWKTHNSHAYKVLHFAKEYSPFTFQQFESEFSHLKNPRANIKTFCYESYSEKGIFLRYTPLTKTYELPKFIQKFLNF